MNKIKHTLLIILTILSAASAFAQGKIVVKGTVKDSKGEPIIGAVVMLKGSTSVGTTTGVDGTYTLTIPANVAKPSLSVSCISYQEQIIEVGNKAVIDIVLEDDNQQLEEVVVVGYGAMRRSDLTGSVTSVKIDEAEAGRSASLDQLLQGRAAGVHVTHDNASPDGGMTVYIRGMNSFNGNSQPLYVVDGIIIDASSDGATLFTQGSENAGGDESTNGLLGINPSDIASIEILKDASATAIYGADGASGVILITTKQAVNDKPQVKFSVGLDLSSVYKKMDVMNLQEFSEYCKIYDAGYNSTKGRSYLKKIWSDPDNLEGLLVEEVDWQDYLMRKAVSQRYHVSISGKPKNTSYMFSLGYSNKQGVISTSSTEQYTMRLNLDNKISKKFSIGTKSSFAFVNSHLVSGTNSGSMTSSASLMRSMLNTRPYRAKTVDTDEEDEDDEDVETEEDEDAKSGPNKWIKNSSNIRQEFRFNPSAYAQWNITPWLTFKSTAGADLKNSERSKFKSALINKNSSAGSIGAVSYAMSLKYNIDNLFLFNKKFKGGHDLSGTLGQSASRTYSQTSTVEAWALKQYKARINCINSADNALYRYGETESTKLSFFTRAVYNYKNRYVLTTTFRLDGSSKFLGKNKYAPFPSMAFAWRLNEEPWFNAGAISMAKFRLGWGRVGNASVSGYQTVSTYSNYNIPNHNPENLSHYDVDIYPANIANPSLKWETTEQVNLGIDFAMWKGRLALSVDAYDKVTYDLLQSKPVAISSGFTTVWVNEGTIDNKGLEFSIDGTPVKTKSFEWAVNGNISFNRNKIVSIVDNASKTTIYYAPGDPRQVDYFLGSAIGTGGTASYPANIYMTGYPMGLFYGFMVDGMVPVGGAGVPESEGGVARSEGSMNIVDCNGNGYIDNDDRCIIGDPNPDFIFGFGTNLSLKRLTMSMSFNGVYGNDICFVTGMLLRNTTKYSSNKLATLLTDTWTPERTDARYPAVGKLSSNDVKKITNLDIEDGSFLRLADISLAYEVPISKKSTVLKGLNISFNVGNAYVWTKYPGFDPEVNSYGNDIRRKGVDNGSYPKSRTLSFDCKFTF